MNNWEITEARKKYWASMKEKRGEGTPRWKGDEAGMSAMHKWLDVAYGKPRFCESCGSQDKRRYDWANINGEYKRDKEDYLRLCTSCHRKFDMTEEKRQQAIKNLRRWNPYYGTERA